MKTNNDIDTSFLQGDSESDQRFRIIAGDGLVSLAITMDGEPTDRVAIVVSADVALRMATRLYAAGRQANGELPVSASQVH